MTHIHCKTCKAVLILESKSLDDQAVEYGNSGWTEIQDSHGNPINYCPACSRQRNPGPFLPMGSSQDVI